MENEYLLVLRVDDREIIIPEIFTIVLDPVYLAEKRRAEEIERLEEQIAGRSQIPTDEELLEFGKLTHPYFQLKRQLESLINYNI